MCKIEDHLWMESGPVIALASGRDWWRQKLAAVVPIRRGGSVVRVEVPRANIRPVVDVPTPTNRAHLRGVDEVRRKQSGTHCTSRSHLIEYNKIHAIPA